MPNLNHANNWTYVGEASRGQTITQQADTVNAYDVNFSSSGAVVVPSSGDTLPPFAKLAYFAAFFPGTGTDVTVKLWASGGYLSGSVIDTLQFQSGRQVAAWTCSGPLPNPFHTLSGQIAAISCTNNYLASGQVSSGAVRIGTYN